jgi:hypothetical protein
VWRAYRVAGYYGTRWLTGLWSTQSEVEGIVLKAAWHWVVIAVSKTNPVGNRPQPIIFSLLSSWGSVDGDRIFLLFRGRVP